MRSRQETPAGVPSAAKSRRITACKVLVVCQEKCHAQIHGIPCRCVEETTDKQLTEALADLLAELTARVT